MADIAAEAGMRYFIFFTTKHHDGFCMWDTQYSDYKITASDCPFHNHRYADVCAHLFEAFRKKKVLALLLIFLKQIGILTVIGVISMKEVVIKIEVLLIIL